MQLSEIIKQSPSTTLSINLATALCQTQNEFLAHKPNVNRVAGEEHIISYYGEIVRSHDTTNASLSLVMPCRVDIDSQTNKVLDCLFFGNLEDENSLMATGIDDLDLEAIDDNHTIGILEMYLGTDSPVVDWVNKSEAEITSLSMDSINRLHRVAW